MFLFSVLFYSWVSAGAPGSALKCPLAVKPLEGIGPLTWQTTAMSVPKGFKSDGQGSFTGPGLSASICKNKVTEIWADVRDLPPGCLTLNGHPLFINTPVKNARRWLGGCTGMIAQGDRTVFECEQNVRLVALSGTLLQVRIGNLILKEKCHP